MQVKMFFWKHLYCQIEKMFFISSVQIINTRDKTSVSLRDMGSSVACGLTNLFIKRRPRKIYS